jgi:hypothetical protein
MISKEVIEHLSKEKIGKDKNIDIAKGLHKLPSSFKEWINYIKFTFKHGKQC